MTGLPVWWAGHEGQGIPDLDQVQVDESITAAALLRRAATEHWGRLDLFAIRPLTNVAEAITADDSFAASLHHLYIMGGAFWMDRPEHNFKCDPEAAEIVIRSGIAMTVCGLDVTQRVWLRQGGISETAGSIGSLLEDEVRRWWSLAPEYPLRACRLPAPHVRRSCRTHGPRRPFLYYYSHFLAPSGMPIVYQPAFR